MGVPGTGILLAAGGLFAVAAGTTAATAATTAVSQVRIEVFGIERTRREALLSMAGLREGMTTSEVDPVAIRRRLLRTQLFRDVEVEVTPGPTEPVVAIRVREKRSVYAVPLVTLSSKENRFGAVLMDWNVAGRGLLAAVGGYGGNRGYAGFFHVSAARVAASPWSGKVEGALSRQPVWRYDPTGRLVDAYVMEEDALRLEAAHAFHDTFRLVAGGVVRTQRTEGLEGFAHPPPGGNTTGLRLGAEYDATDSLPTFQEGWKGAVRADWTTPLVGADATNLVFRAEGSWCRGIAGGANLVAGGFAAWTSAASDRFLLWIGGEEGARGFYTGGFWADLGAAAYFEAQVPFLHTPHGTATVVAFTDHALLRDGGRPHPSYLPAVGSGLRVYLSGVSIPAVGVDVAWSPVLGEEFVEAYVGAAY